MGAFLKIFIAMLCMSVMLSVSFPNETQFIKDNFFTQLLTEQTDPITGNSTYTSFSTNLDPQWSEGGNEESSFLQKFVDGLSVIKTTINTLINIAVVPIMVAVSNSFNMPAIVRIMIFIPLALLYVISAIATLIRGVNP